ncbi:uncharacterized protein LOC113545725 [Pangasianodon hypophthalmus]|uniref:uncharacterized protein LOC113545725 n=1 Tax=Pangasianodon hypophthalmus TaxID=310915 RepID=UPI000F007784|nr:uncharacterized protein LOC113545725 [Pangasianodon hypophthalmus]
MRPQPSVFLRALCLLLSMAPVFHGASASLNTTNVTATTMTYNTSATESAAPTTTPDTNFSFEETQDTSTIITTSSETRSTTTTTVPSNASPTAATTQANVGTVVCLILFFCFLILLSFCAYKWYIHQGRPSCLEIWRRVTECARNAWAMAVACLRPSSKAEEVDEEMEAGITEAEEQKKQEEDADDEDDDDDSSDNYSCMDGTAMMEKPKKDEEEDGQSSEGEDDMSSVELKDEKTEREKDDLTVL